MSLDMMKVFSLRHSASVQAHMSPSISLKMNLTLAVDFLPATQLDHIVFHQTFIETRRLTLVWQNRSVATNETFISNQSTNEKNVVVSFFKDGGVFNIHSIILT